MKRNTVVTLIVLTVVGAAYWTFWGSPESPQRMMKIFNGIQHGRSGWVDFCIRMDLLPRPAQERLTAYLVAKLPDRQLEKFIWDNIDGDYTKLFFEKSRPASGDLLDRLRIVRWEKNKWGGILSATSRQEREQAALSLVTKMPSHMLYNFVFTFHENVKENGI